MTYKEHMRLSRYDEESWHLIKDLSPESQTLLARRLPKWSQLLVTGTPVTREQAKEIIRRTDQFFLMSTGNDEEYEMRVLSLLGAESLREDSQRAKRRQDKWKSLWGFIDTLDVDNCWISNCNGDGPNGWCHPDGILFYEDNVGSHADLRYVYFDWGRIARCFPFLELEASALNGEEDDCERLISFVIRGGRVDIFSPHEIDVHEGREFHRRDPDYIHPCSDEDERGIPWEWIEEWSCLAKERGLV